MPCSAYTLSLATIASVVSVALIAIAFSTDNWSRITVDRLKLEVLYKMLFPTFRKSNVCLYIQPQVTRGDLALGGELESNILYFSRTKGLFRICFDDKKVPKGGQTVFFLKRYCISLCTLSNRVAQFSNPFGHHLLHF